MVRLIISIWCRRKGRNERIHRRIISRSRLFCNVLCVNVLLTMMALALVTICPGIGLDWWFQMEQAWEVLRSVVFGGVLTAYETKVSVLKVLK